MGPSFSAGALKGLEPTMASFIDVFINGIHSTSRENEGTVEITQWFLNLSFDVLFI
jgi:hypothetical protein